MDNVGPIPLISCPNETVRAMLMPDEFWGRETVVRGYIILAEPDANL